MAKTLAEYVDWLDERDLNWPHPPAVEPAKATPFLKPLPGIRALSWNPYGTLLRISDGELLFDHPQELRMRIALDKTIREFNMWHSMTRRPGEPWKQMHQQYEHLLTNHRMSGTKHRGDVPEVDSRKIWRVVIERLQAKEYTYDRPTFGDEDELAEKVAYFFHASLQGVEAAENADLALKAVAASGLSQSLLGNGQSFTVIQLLRALRAQGAPSAPGDLFSLDCLTLSFQEGVRTPSKSLYRSYLRRLSAQGIDPAEALHVGCRLEDDLAVAKSLGMRTVLYAGDKLSLRATREEMKQDALRPDRLLTDLAQIRDVLQIG